LIVKIILTIPPINLTITLLLLTELIFV